MSLLSPLDLLVSLLSPIFVRVLTTIKDIGDIRKKTADNFGDIAFFPRHS
jgi:hypothetical protein